jgi:hypothetical protein
MAQVYKKIDPSNNMSQDARTFAGLSAVFNYASQRVDPLATRRAAYSLLYYYHFVQSRFALIESAAAGADHGNVGAAAKAALKTYANIPDGKNLQLSKDQNGQVRVSYVDSQGKTISGGLITPPQLAAQALGVRPEDFEPLLTKIIGDGPPPEECKPTSPAAALLALPRIDDDDLREPSPPSAPIERPRQPLNCVQRSWVPIWQPQTVTSMAGQPVCGDMLERRRPSNHNTIGSILCEVTDGWADLTPLPALGDGCDGSMGRRA